MSGQAEVRASGLLPAGDGHQVYWEESGNPGGIPAVYLHGGPGGTLGTGGYRSRFDPSRFRIIGLAEAWTAANIRHADRISPAAG